ncbi:hypothetical protein E2C01_076062 [Portunus trituberculatus]|uniref:Uncharacterized protein n=1 Tax=Portunus trituberculatus TaxID=210409 RepID=A0A5B7IHD5_PORTR|nr:hypothetical protein [Portunus trituberculatus]
MFTRFLYPERKHQWEVKHVLVAVCGWPGASHAQGHALSKLRKTLMARVSKHVSDCRERIYRGTHRKQVCVCVCVCVCVRGAVNRVRNVKR